MKVISMVQFSVFIILEHIRLSTYNNLNKSSARSHESSLIIFMYIQMYDC